MSVAAEQFCVGGGRLSAAVLALVVVDVAAVALAGLLLDGLTRDDGARAVCVSHSDDVARQRAWLIDTRCSSVHPTARLQMRATSSTTAFTLFLCFCSNSAAMSVAGRWASPSSAAARCLLHVPSGLHDAKSPQSQQPPPPK